MVARRERHRPPVPCFGDARRIVETTPQAYNGGLPEARQAMPFELETWKQREGQSVEAVFLLERCSGGSSGGAVFETQFQGRPAVIKLIPGTPESIDASLVSWEKAAKLSHPALVQIFARGKTALGNMRCAYIVMERADENLADVLAERALTPTETRDMLLPLLGALQYLNANGFAHGELKPANIMAFGEQLKICSDSLVPGGDFAAESLAIQVLLRQVLGAGEKAQLPGPFAEIVSNCSNPDPAVRWNLQRIEACLRGDPAPGAPPSSRTVWWSLAAAAAVILFLIAIWPSKDNNAGSPEPVEKANPAPAATSSKPSAATKPEAEPVQAQAPVVRTKASAEQRPATMDGITQVLPEIPPAARNTINGRVRISVRVRVDSQGNVNQATPEPPLAGKYFTDRALVAARAWKFPSGNSPQDWLLRFELTREQTRVSLAKAGN